MQITEFDDIPKALATWQRREVRIREFVTDGADTLAARGILYPDVHGAGQDRVLRLSVNLAYNQHQAFEMADHVFDRMIVDDEQVVILGQHGSLVIEPVAA